MLLEDETNDSQKFFESLTITDEKQGGIIPSEK